MSKRTSSWTGASLALLLSLVVFPLATPSVVLGQGNGNGNTGTGTNSQGQLVITAADVSGTVITVTGQNFGETAPDAFLGLPDGSIVDLTFESLFLPTAFTADLPGSITPGNYLLIVRSGNGSTRIDSMDITIGAVGDPGPQGVQGIPGNLALAGLACPAGDALFGFAADGSLICRSVKLTRLFLAGVSTNLPESDVLDGEFTRCFQGLYTASGANLATILAGCQGEVMMLACRQVGQPNLQVAAMALKSDVTTNTGNGNTPHDANGVGWYLRACQTITDFCVLGAAGWIV